MKKLFLLGALLIALQATAQVEFVDSASINRSPLCGITPQKVEITKDRATKTYELIPTETGAQIKEDGKFFIKDFSTLFYKTVKTIYPVQMEDGSWELGCITSVDINIHDKSFIVFTVLTLEGFKTTRYPAGSYKIIRPPTPAYFL